MTLAILLSKKVQATLIGSNKNKIIKGRISRKRYCQNKK